MKAAKISGTRLLNLECNLKKKWKGGGQEKVWKTRKMISKDYEQARTLVIAEDLRDDLAGSVAVVQP